MYSSNTGTQVLMAYMQKQKYRITLEMDVLEDFNPHQIDWTELFDLGGDENVTAYIEDLSRDRVW
jgi:hypothetical protein